VPQAGPELGPEERGLGIIDTSSELAPLTFDSTPAVLEQGSDNALEIRSTAPIGLPVSSSPPKKRLFVVLVGTTLVAAVLAASFLHSGSLHEFTARLSGLSSGAISEQQGAAGGIAARNRVAWVPPPTTSVQADSEKTASVAAESASGTVTSKAVLFLPLWSPPSGEESSSEDDRVQELPAVRDRTGSGGTQLAAAPLSEAVANSRQTQARDPNSQNRDSLAAKASTAQVEAAQLAASRAAEEAARGDQALEQERNKVDSLARELAAARDEVKALISQADRELTSEREPMKAMETASQNRAAWGQRPESIQATAPIKGEQLEVNATALNASAPEGALLARAAVFVEQSNIVGARLLLERALENGSARAAFALAETYDPRTLSHWRAHGMRSDAEKARDLYNRAFSGGIEEAHQRLQALR
jgi:hypothetical protein